MRWYGHVRRMSTSRTALRWLEWKPNTARPRGRPRKRWMDNVKEAVEVRGSTLKEIEQSALFLANGKPSSLTGHRPTRTVVQGTRGAYALNAPCLGTPLLSRLKVFLGCGMPHRFPDGVGLTSSNAAHRLFRLKTTWHYRVYSSPTGKTFFMPPLSP